VGQVGTTYPPYQADPPHQAPQLYQPSQAYPPYQPYPPTTAGRLFAICVACSNAWASFSTSRSR